MSGWVRDIDLSGRQRDMLVDRARTRRNRSRSAHFRARRLTLQEDERALARAGDPLHAAGCMLYWAEGSKSRNAAQKYHDVPDEAFRIDCNLFADHVERQNEIERF